MHFWIPILFVTVSLLSGACNRIEARVDADKGYRAFMAKDYEGAISLYDEAHRLTPNDTSVMRNLGYAHLSLAQQSTSSAIASQHYIEAIKHLEKVVKEDPDDKELAGVMLEAWTQSDRLDEAAKFYHERASLAPKDPEAWRLLGMVEMRRGNYQAALDTYDRRQKLSPDDAQLYAAKATLCWEWLRSGGPPDAARAIDVASLGLEAALQAVKRDPKHPSALVYAGLLLRQRAARQTETSSAAHDLMEAQKYLQMVKAHH